MNSLNQVNNEFVLPEDDDALVSRDKAGKCLGVQPNTLANWACNNRYDLPVIKIGRLSKYRVGDLRQVMKDGLVKVEKEAC